MLRNLSFKLEILKYLFIKNIILESFTLFKIKFLISM